MRPSSAHSDDRSSSIRTRPGTTGTSRSSARGHRCGPPGWWCRTERQGRRGPSVHGQRAGPTGHRGAWTRARGWPGACCAAVATSRCRSSSGIVAIGAPGSTRAGEADLALVHVAHPAGDALVEQHVADGRGGIGQGRHAGDALVEVGVGATQVRTEVSDRRCALEDRGRRVEAHRLDTRHLDPRPHAMARPAPRLARRVPLPAAVHLEVGPQRRAVGEPDQQVLAGRVDGLDEGPRRRRPRASPRRSGHLDLHHRLTGEHVAQLCSQPMDRVTLGHPPRLRATACRPGRGDLPTGPDGVTYSVCY